MAALRGCGIDNVHVDINGPEVPIMDGSAAPFVKWIEEAGIKTLGKTAQISGGEEAGHHYRWRQKSNYHPVPLFQDFIRHAFQSPRREQPVQERETQRERFSAKISPPARTFGFLAEVETLKANGLAQGGSLENAVVIGNDGILNKEGLRF